MLRWIAKLDMSSQWWKTPSIGLQPSKSAQALRIRSKLDFGLYEVKNAERAATLLRGRRQFVSPI